jgi:nitric oxide reductase large subunit
MNHGTVLGNGAYFGNDLPADALESKTECVRAFYAEQRYGEPYADLTAPERAAVDERAREDLRSRSDSPEDGALTYSAAGAYAHEQVREDYVARYHEGNESLGLAIMVGASLLPIGSVSWRPRSPRATTPPGASRSTSGRWCRRSSGCASPATRC